MNVDSSRRIGHVRTNDRLLPVNCLLYLADLVTFASSQTYVIIYSPNRSFPTQRINHVLHLIWLYIQN